MSNPVKPVDLLGTMDAMIWAREFVRIFRGKACGDGEPIDEGLMVGWFANAMVTGEAFGRKCTERELRAQIREASDVAEYRGREVDRLERELKRIRELEAEHNRDVSASDTNRDISRKDVTDAHARKNGASTPEPGQNIEKQHWDPPRRRVKSQLAEKYQAEVFSMNPDGFTVAPYCNSETLADAFEAGWDACERKQHDLGVQFTAANYEAQVQEMAAEIDRLRRAARMVVHQHRNISMNQTDVMADAIDKLEDALKAQGERVRNLAEKGGGQ